MLNSKELTTSQSLFCTRLVNLGFKVMVDSLTNQKLLMVVLGDIVTEKQPEHNGLVVQIILVELGLINMVSTII